MNYKNLLLAFACFGIFSCSKFDLSHFKDHEKNTKEDPSAFSEIASLDIGEAGAAEISAYDPKTKRLFVVNNSTTNKIDVIGLQNVSSLAVIASIDVVKYGGLVNSVAVHDGLLAAAIESVNKQEPGKVVVFKTSDYSVVKVIAVGALPDMITFSPDGKYILTANEGEPDTDYKNDPLGTVSVISVREQFSVVNIDFSSFQGLQSDLQRKGLRVFGPNASFAQDMEPEYVAVSDDSRIAWVTLQENNAIAKIDLQSKSVTAIFPLGFKNYNIEPNAIDPSDRDSKITFNKWPVKGMYQPDAIAVLHDKGIPYLFTANEGDVREYNAFNEAKRVGSLTLDAAAFPNAAALLLPEQLGRLNVTATLGDEGKDNKYEALYSFGARSFSVWNGYTGALVYDSKNELDRKAVEPLFYDDGRSDDKGVEPEGIALGFVGKKNLAFVGLERADAVAIYDVTNPVYPSFLQILKTGDGPEGVLFIPAKDSPNQQSLLIISSENDGVIKIYAPKKL
ncbi:MAG: choice-of-anchor I family protein [Chitinophagaceae bacterium]|nr:choice-of-anchor I family protein [Chitinophagaceae bacterium]